MPERMAFVSAICETPQDDTPRLVFADWLMDRDDPRGEFISVQCQLARMAPYDPARPALVKLEEALLGRHRRAWNRELGLPEADDAPGLEYRRGFIEIVTGNPEQLALLPQDLPARTPLREVQLSLVGGGYLSLDQVDMTRSLPPLAWFREVTIIGFDTMHGSFNFLTTEQLGTVLHSPCLAALTALRLIEIGLTDAGQVLASWPGLARLSHLVLKDNWIGPSFRAVAESAYFPRLISLDLCRTSIDLASLTALARAPAAAGLAHLNLSRCPLGDDLGHILAEASFTGSLERLNLDECQLGDAGLVALLAGLRTRSLRELTLDENHLTAESARALAAWPGARALTTLRLRGARLGPEGLAALLDSPYRGPWVDLSLSGRIELKSEEEKTTREVLVPNIGAEGVRRLISSPAAATLMRLDVCYNDLNEADLLALAESPYLERIGQLHISEIGLTYPSDPACSAAVKALRERFGERVRINDWSSVHS